MNKEFKKYMNMYHIGWQIATICLGVVIVASIISSIIRNDSSAIGAQFILFVALCITLIPLIRSKLFFEQMENSVSFAKIEEEFVNSFPMLKDRVRFGTNYIFAKHSGKILEYSSIRQVYQYIHKTNFAEDKRALKYVDTWGNHRTICKLELGGRSDVELTKVLAIIMSKNPDVKIGYR